MYHNTHIYICVCVLSTRVCMPIMSALFSLRIAIHFSFTLHHKFMVKTSCHYIYCTCWVSYIDWRTYCQSTRRIDVTEYNLMCWITLLCLCAHYDLLHFAFTPVLLIQRTEYKICTKGRMETNGWPRSGLNAACNEPNFWRLLFYSVGYVLDTYFQNTQIYWKSNNI